MGITSAKLQDTFSVNRGYIEMVTTKLIEMQTTKWDGTRKNFYSHTFDVGASILSIYDRIELDRKIRAVELKYNLSLRALENLLYFFSNWAFNKKIMIKTREKRDVEDDSQFDYIHKTILNWHIIENSLREILFWLNLKCQNRASALGIDYKKISELTRVTPEKPTLE